MVEVQKSIDDQLNLQEYVIKEISSELQELGKEAFYKEENGTKEVDISKVDAFLNTIKDQEWKALKDQKRDRLWITAVQIKLASLGYDLGSKKIDGWFGAKTREAVKQFQIAMNFPENQRDGLPGPQTIKKLLAENDAKATGNKASQKEELVDVGGVKHKKIRLNSIDELPNKDGDYKWDSNGEKKIYAYKLDDKEYIFYDNGRVWMDGKMSNSKDIIAQLKTHQKTDENPNPTPQQTTNEHYEGETSNIEGLAETILSTITNINENKTILNIYGKQYNFEIAATGDALKFSVEGASFSMPLKNLLDKEAKLDKNRWTKIILPQIQEGLQENLTAQKIAKALRGKTYTKQDLKLANLENQVSQTGINNYFNIFDDQKILIDTSEQFTKAEKGDIFIHLDNSGGDKDYNKPSHNADLKIAAKNIANDKGELDEGKFKDKLKTIIENIVKKYFEIESS